MDYSGGYAKGKKRIFVLLLAFSLLILIALAGLFLFMALHRDSIFTFWFNIFVVAAIMGMFLFAGIGVLQILITLAGHGTPGPLRRFFIRMALNLYPLALKLGHLFGISNDVMWTSFVDLNNQLVLTYRKKVPAERMLLLLPHCLQKSDCPRKVTADIANCTQCGRCNIGALKELCEQLGVHCFVSTGGTLARQAVKQIRPQAVVAVACGRDLFSGIMDVRPLPTLGVLNERPNGPCHDTCVDPESVSRMLHYFLAERFETDIEVTA